MAGSGPINLDPAAASRLLRALSDDPPAADSPLPTPHSPLSPHIPGYTVDRPLGEGGGGTVFRAFRNGSDRALALKVLRARAGDPQSKRAWRELEMLDSLRLPALPRLIDYGTHDGHLYFAAEFIEGLTLEKHCRENSLDRRARMGLLAQIADAVQSLHEHGVIHRDIKPSNIIVMPDGTPMLVDLGLAVHDAPGSEGMTMTAEGQPVGTPAFMAPEQARGERAKISTRTDVYGLGATAYLVLTGQTPHDTATSIHEAVRRVAQDAARDPRTLDPTLPRGLAAVLGKACAREAAKRYASAAEFGEDLTRWLRGEAVTAGEMSVWGKGWRWVGRHPVWATGVVCAGMVLATGILSYVVGRKMAFGIAEEVNLRPNGFLDHATTEAERHRHITLRSNSGSTLATLGAVLGSEVPIAEFAEWPDEYRGEWVISKVAVICVHGEAALNYTNGQVWICDPSDLARPKFSTEAINRVPPWPPDLGPGVVEPSPEQYKFTINYAFLADIYGDVPGREIVSLAFGGNHSPSAVSIHSLRGELLYRAWHFGPVRSAGWIAKDRVLVCTGDRHARATHSWKVLGYPEPEARLGELGQYPFVVFGLRLGDSYRGEHFEWLDDCRFAGEGRPLAWYKAVWPPVEGALARCGVPERDRTPSGSSMRLALRLNPPETTDSPIPRVAFEQFGIAGGSRLDGTFSVLIDADGRIVSRAPELNDSWTIMFGNDAERAMGAARRFELVDFPPGLPKQHP